MRTLTGAFLFVLLLCGNAPARPLSPNGASRAVAPEPGGHLLSVTPDVREGTLFDFVLERAGEVRLTLRDARGERPGLEQTHVLGEGLHRWLLEDEELAEGTWLATLSTGGSRHSLKILLLR